jgi:hypothetical protein
VTELHTDRLNHRKSHHQLKINFTVDSAFWTSRCVSRLYIIDVSKEHATFIYKDWEVVEKFRGYVASKWAAIAQSV